MTAAKLNKQWFGNIRGDILSGIVVALALIPEAIAFSIIAGVDPMVGLYASFSMAVVIAIVGGRPAMISAATGAMALLMVTLVKDHGLQYLFATTILTGVLQLLFGVLGIARFMKFIPRSVMIGFVNALAILIFMAQVPHFIGINTITYILVGATLIIIYLFPLITKAVPAPLVAILAITIISMFLPLDVRTVGDLGEIKQALPSFLIPDLPLNLETLQIIFPTALALSIVGLLESLLTASIVDDMTDTDSNKNKEARGQGVANIVTGFFGGMAGCAMIGQSVINVKSGGRGRLSTLVAGVFLMFLILVLGDWVVKIPMPALVGVMIMVCIGTFDWQSLRSLTRVPLSDSTVMIVTVVAVVVTHNLSIGVLLGILLSAMFFVAKISKVKVDESTDTNGERIRYTITGQLFFASVTDFTNNFLFDVHAKHITLDFTNTHVWDDSAVAAIDKIVLKFREKGSAVTIEGLNKESQALVNRMTADDSAYANVSNH